MKSKERVMKAINHQEPDKVPLDIGVGRACNISVTAYRNLLNYLGITVDKIEINSLTNQLVKVHESIFEKFNIDFRPIRMDNSTDRKEDVIKEEDDYLVYYDEWHRTWKMPKKKGYYYDMVEFPLAEIEYENYEWPNPRKPERFVSLEEQADFYSKNTDAALVFSDGFGNGFLQMGAQLFGYDKWFLMLGIEPRKVEKFLNDYLEIKISFWDEVLSRIGDKVDVVCELDDLGTQRGPWISRDMYKKFIKPRQKKLFDFIKSKTDAKIFFHSCGSIYDFIPDLIEVGIDILNPIQTSAEKMDAQTLKKEFGKDLVFWGGGIDTQKVLPYGTESEVKDAVKRNIEILAPGGGYVFATVHNIQPDVPPENIIAMLEAFQEYSYY